MRRALAVWRLRPALGRLRPAARRGAVLVAALGLLPAPVLAHDGPPYPIVTARASGPYSVSIWTDPDTTDDGSAGGQFWVIVTPAASGMRLPDDLRVTVAIAPLDRSGPGLTAGAGRDSSDGSRWFAALPMDHEGRFRVRVVVESSLGAGDVESEVDATYDTRPPPIMLVIYAVPFLLAGFLWLNLIVRRRKVVNGPSVHSQGEKP